MKLYRLTVEPNPWGRGPWVADREFKRQIRHKNVGCLYFSNARDMYTDWIDFLPKKFSTFYLWEFYLPNFKVKNESIQFILPEAVVRANVKRVRLVEIIFNGKRKMKKKGRRKPPMKVTK